MPRTASVRDFLIAVSFRAAVQRVTCEPTSQRPLRCCFSFFFRPPVMEPISRLASLLLAQQVEGHRRRGAPGLDDGDSTCPSQAFGGAGLHTKAHLPGAMPPPSERHCAPQRGRPRLARPRIAVLKSNSPTVELMRPGQQGSGSWRAISTKPYPRLSAQDGSGSGDRQFQDGPPSRRAESGLPTTEHGRIAKVHLGALDRDRFATNLAVNRVWIAEAIRYAWRPLAPPMSLPPSSWLYRPTG